MIGFQSLVYKQLSAHNMLHKRIKLSTNNDSYTLACTIYIFNHVFLNDWPLILSTIGSQTYNLSLSRVVCESHDVRIVSGAFQFSLLCHINKHAPACLT